MPCRPPGCHTYLLVADGHQQAVDAVVGAADDQLRKHDGPVRVYCRVGDPIPAGPGGTGVGGRGRDCTEGGRGRAARRGRRGWRRSACSRARPHARQAARPHFCARGPGVCTMNSSVCGSKVAVVCISTALLPGGAEEGLWLWLGGCGEGREGKELCIRQGRAAWRMARRRRLPCRRPRSPPCRCAGAPKPSSVRAKQPMSSREVMPACSMSWCRCVPSFSTVPPNRLNCWW